MVEGKPIRLSKAAREFNIGTHTIVEYLEKKGFDVESNPNSKLSPEMYQMLREAYSQDKQVKEESQKRDLEYIKRQTISIDEDFRPEDRTAPQEDEEHLFVKGATVETDKELVNPAPEQITKKEVQPEKPQAEAQRKTEAEPDPEKKPAEIGSKEDEPAEAEETQPDAPESNAASETKELRVIGKIDLNSINQKTKPARKSKEQKQREADEKRKAEKELQKKANLQKEAEEKKKEQDRIQAEKTKQEEQEAKAKEALKAKAQEKEENFIPTSYEKLSGPKIVDKIELPEIKEKKKQPVASSSDSTVQQKKKKRKRIRTDQPDPQKKGKPTQTRDKKGRKANQPQELSEEDIQKQIKETLARLTPTGKSKGSKHRRQKREEIHQKKQEELKQQEEGLKVLQVTEFVTVNELASMMSVPVNEIIATCMNLGLFVSINQRLDAETISLLAEEFGFSVEFVSLDVVQAIETTKQEEDPADLEERAPIVTVMGHVDHGKTLLLDYIRKANVVSGEAGGITQHIGAYEVLTESGKKITFLDTPGHEAFTAMRARGAKLTDVAIIVIAADDSVMPQTKEAINHAQAAGVPIVFAFNKIDKPSANAEKIREELAQMNLLVEEWGGKYQAQEISAKTGQGIDDLLEKVLLESELLELKGNPKKPASGTVIESSLDKGRGYICKLLVQDGSISIGDMVLAGATYGKIKAMFNEYNKRISKAGPSTPVLLLGLNGAPQAGDGFNVMADEREAKEIASKRRQLQREQGLRTQKHITLDEIGRRIAIGDFKELNIIVKADVDGSVEALSDSLLKLSTAEVQVNVIHKSVGAITETDVMLATASNAIVVGFQVRPTMQARQLAEQEQIDVRLYSIIYQAIEEIKSAIEGMLSPKMEEKITSNLEVRETFKITKVGTIAGCMVLDGKIKRNTRIRLIRDGIVIYTGSLGSLKRFKDDVKEVAAGFECGLNIENFNDIKVGDIIEGYEEVEVSRSL